MNASPCSRNSPNVGNSVEIGSIRHLLSVHVFVVFLLHCPAKCQSHTVLSLHISTNLCVFVILSEELLRGSSFYNENDMTRCHVFCVTSPVMDKNRAPDWCVPSERGQHTRHLLITESEWTLSVLCFRRFGIAQTLLGKVLHSVCDPNDMSEILRAYVHRFTFCVVCLVCL
jgi:hypothetical protein